MFKADAADRGIVRTAGANQHLFAEEVRPAFYGSECMLGAAEAILPGPA